MLIFLKNERNPRCHFGFTPLFTAAQLGHLKICRRLVKDSTEPNPKRDSDGSTPLHIATFKGHISIVEMILKNITDKNPGKNDGVTPLQNAAFCFS